MKNTVFVLRERFSTEVGPTEVQCFVQDSMVQPHAKGVLVFMVVHNDGSWKVPCAYFLYNGLIWSTLASIFKNDHYYKHLLSLSSSHQVPSVTIITTTTISHCHRQNHNHLSLSSQNHHHLSPSSQPPTSVAIYHHIQHHLSLSSSKTPPRRGAMLCTYTLLTGKDGILYVNYSYL